MKVRVELVITNDDGSEFSRQVNEWSGMTRAETNYLEGMGIKFLDELNKIGEKLAPDKGKPA